MASNNPLIKDNSSSSNFSYLFNNFNPAFSNLFEINVENEEFGPNHVLYATGINLKGDNITLKRHEVSKLFSLERYNRNDIVTINWREDDNFSIKNFHMAWISKFYNREKDVYISYDTKEEAIKNLYKKLKVNMQGGYSLILEGVLPQSALDLNLNWSGPEVVNYSTTYYVTSWEWKDPQQT